MQLTTEDQAESSCTKQLLRLPIRQQRIAQYLPPMIICLMLTHRPSHFSTIVLPDPSLSPSVQRLSYNEAPK